jgi:hypothetical protein
MPVAINIILILESNGDPVHFDLQSFQEESRRDSVACLTFSLECLTPTHELHENPPCEGETGAFSALSDATRASKDAERRTRVAGEAFPLHPLHDWRFLATKTTVPMQPTNPMTAIQGATMASLFAGITTPPTGAGSFAAAT